MNEIEDESMDQTVPDEIASDEGMDESMGEGFVTEGRKPSVSPASLVALCLAVVAVGAIYLMRMSGGPQSAAAATPAAESAHATVNEFLTDGGRNLKAMQDMLRNTERVVQQFAAFPSQTQVPLDDLKTNPFRFAAPVPVGGVEESEAAAKKRKDAAIAAAQKLKLQSVLYGQSRACVIGGKVYSEGQSVDGIEIEKINPRSVLVKSGEFHLEVKMQKD